MKLFLFVFIAHAHGQLTRVPRSGPPLFTRPLHVFQHYDVDLPMPFLPLCGNGVLNTKQDYEQHYRTHPAFRVGTSDVQVIVDEECDDGNRRDGDGCSADCMDVDSIVPPCKVETPQAIRALSVDQKNGNTYVATPDGLHLLTVTKDGILLTKLMDQEIESMFASDGKVFFFNKGALSVYETDIVRPLVTTGTAKCHWVMMADTFYFIASSSTSVWIMDCRTRELKTFATLTPSSEATPSSEFKECHADKSQAYIKCGVADGYYEIRYSSGVTFIPYTPSAYPDNVWLKAFFTLMDATAMQYFFPISRPQLLGSSSYSVSTDREIAVSSDFFAVSKSNVRALLSPALPSVFQTTPIQAIGNKELINVTTSLDFQCYLGERCYMDIPVTQDVYSGTSDTMTYFDLLRDLMAKDLATAFTEFSKQLRASRSFPTTVTQHPKTKAFLILHNGNIYYIGRRGTSIRKGDGSCIPFDVKACPEGHWGDTENTCTPCTMGTTELAKSFQCTGTVARRRLLQANVVKVVATINVPDPILKAEFPDATVSMGTVTIESSDPSQALQHMSRIIAMHPSWTVVLNPTALYSVPEPPKSDSGIDVGVIAGIVMGTVTGLALMAVVILKLLFMCSTEEQTTVKTVTSGLPYKIFD